jgi:hypothetical protein
MEYETEQAARPGATNEAEIIGLRAQLQEIAHHLADIVPEPVVGVILPTSERLPALEQLRTAIVIAELRRRLSGVRVGAFTAAGDPSGLFDGEPVYSLNSSVPVAIDCAVLARTGDDGADGAMGRLSVPACHLGDGCSGVPSDALVLMDRILDEDFLNLRGIFLRAVGTIPLSTGFALELFTTGDAHERASQATRAVARSAKLELIGVPMETAPTDLAAIIRAADLVITDSASVAALAAGFLGAVIVVSDDSLETKWCEEIGIASGGPGDIIALATDVRAQDVNEIRDRLIRSAELSFDSLTGQLLSAVSGPLARTSSARLADLVSRVHSLETVNEGLRRSILRDRSVLVQQIRDLTPDAVATATDTHAAREWMQAHPRTAAEAEIHIAQLREEIDRIHSTRMFRYLSPLRGLYGRLRSVLR